jgi:hypothetical protein
VARVWDALFLEGNKILFRTALAVLKSQEEALLAADNAGAAAGTRQHTAPSPQGAGQTRTCTHAHTHAAACAAAGDVLMVVRQYTSSCHDRDALMRMAFEGIGSMPMAVIERCRLERRCEGSR